MRLLALTLIVSHLALGCTVVVDASPKKKKVQDVVSDVAEPDGAVDSLEVDTITETDDGAEEDSHSDLPMTDLPIDVAPTDVTIEPGVDAGSDGVGTSISDDVGVEPDVPSTTSDYLLDTADDILMNDGTTGTMVLLKEHAVVFPVDLSVPQKNVLALTPDTLLEKALEFSCLGNENVENFFNDTIQKGPGATLKLLQGNPIVEKLNEGSTVKGKAMATVVSVEMELPFEVPQSNLTYEPGTVCYGVYNQGDWYFSFEPVEIQLDVLKKKGTGVLEIEFPAQAEAIAILTGQNIAINWIRYTVVD